MILQLIVFILASAGWTWYRISQIKQPRAAVLFASLMMLSVVAGSLWIANIPLPSTTIPIRGLFEPIGKIITRHY